jgi:hypothetical protein
MSVLQPALTSDQHLISIGLPHDDNTSLEYRYIFPQAFRVVSLEQVMDIEQVPIPLRHFVYAGAGGLSDARKVKLEGTIGGGSNFGGWFSGDHAVNGTFYPEGAIVTPDDVETCLQRISNVLNMRGPGYLRLGHADNRFAWAMISNWQASFLEATFRRVIQVNVELIIPEACFIGPIVTVQCAGTTGTITITPGGSAPCWPSYWLTAAPGVKPWVKVVYPNGSQIVAACSIPADRTDVSWITIATDPRRRGIWNGEGTEKLARDNELTAWLTSQNTRGGGELLPFLHATPAVNTISWAANYVDGSGNGMYMRYRSRWAF